MRIILIAVASLSLLISAPRAFGGDCKGKDCKKCEKPVQDCLNSMVIELKTTGFIGLELDKSEKDELKITEVIEGTPAQKAGIQVGDVLVAINGMKFNKENHEAISKVKKPGAKVTCTIKRNGANKEIKMTLVPMPADLMAKYIGEHMMQHAKQDAAVAEK